MSGLIPKRTITGLARFVRPPIQKETKKTRQESWSGELSVPQKEKLKLLFESVPELFGKVNVMDRSLTSGEVAELMNVALAMEEAELAIKAERSRIREVVLNSVKLDNADLNVDEPDLEPGFLISQAHGKKFSVEGGGRKGPDTDDAKLKQELGEDWNQIVVTTHYPEQVIPARTEQVVDEQLLLKYLQSHPEKMEVIGESLIPGDPKPLKLTIRNIDDQEEA